MKELHWELALYYDVHRFRSCSPHSLIQIFLSNVSIYENEK
jgi:hypothetical protein